MIESVDIRVARGASLLDTYRSTWEKEIHDFNRLYDNLDIRSGTSCILGVIYGSYFTGARNLRPFFYFLCLPLGKWGDALIWKWAKKYGFALSDFRGVTKQRTDDEKEEENQALINAWNREIQARLGPPFYFTPSGKATFRHEGTL